MGAFGDLTQQCERLALWLEAQGVEVQRRWAAELRRLAVAARAERQELLEDAWFEHGRCKARGCENLLPDGSTARREYCSEACKKREQRRRRAVEKWTA